jgi:hypothetical protein
MRFPVVALRSPAIVAVPLFWLFRQRSLSFISRTPRSNAEKITWNHLRSEYSGDQ